MNTNRTNLKGNFRDSMRYTHTCRDFVFVLSGINETSRRKSEKISFSEYYQAVGKWVLFFDLQWPFSCWPFWIRVFKKFSLQNLHKMAMVAQRIWKLSFWSHIPWILNACTFVFVKSVSNIGLAHSMVRSIALMLENVIQRLLMHSLCVEKILPAVEVELFFKNFRLLIHIFGTK